MDERANQFFDDLIDGSTPDTDSEGTLSIDELLEVKQIPHQENSFIDSTEYMAPVAQPDDTTMLVRLAPFASKDNASKATEQPSVDPNVENSLNALESDPFIDPDEYASEDMDAVEDTNQSFEIGFSFDAADTIPYEDDGEYIPLEIITAYRNTAAPGSRIVDDTPVGSDQEVGSLNNNMARIISASGMDVDQAGEDMAKELAMALSKKTDGNPAAETATTTEATSEASEPKGPSFQLNSIFAAENAAAEAEKANQDESLTFHEEVDGFASQQNLTPAEAPAVPEAKDDTMLPAVVGSTAPAVAEKSKKSGRPQKQPGAIEGSKKPNHFGPRTYDPKLEQKPFEYKFDKKKKKKKNSFIHELISYVLIIALAWVAAKLITTYVLINAIVPTGSMVPTINVEDRLFGFRLAYVNSEPARGDIIIFPAPDEPERDFIKRIIGLPGETIEAKNGVITITHTDGSSEILDEPYLNEEWKIASTFGPYTIPEDSYFCLGDNRNSSSDARYWKNKFVKRSDIRAKAILRYWPFNGFGLIK